MNPRSQRICAWCGPAFMVLFGIGFWGVAGFIPPPSPDLSAGEVARLYAENTGRIRAGLAITMLASTLLYPWIAVISVQLKRIEGGTSTPMSYAQLATGAIAFLTFVLPVFVWQTAAYRPEERSEETIKMLNDLGWLPFVGIFSPVCIQCLAIALAIFGDRHSPLVFPRWVAYYNIWACLMFLPATVLPFFKNGPFAWNGLFSLYLPLVAYTGWFAIMFVSLLKAIKSEELEVEASRLSAAPPAERYPA